MAAPLDRFLAQRLNGEFVPCVDADAADALKAQRDALLAAGRQMRAVVSRLALSVVMGAEIGKDIEAAVNEAQDAMNAAIAKAEGQEA